MNELSFAPFPLFRRFLRLFPVMNDYQKMRAAGAALIASDLVDSDESTFHAGVLCLWRARQLKKRKEEEEAKIAEYRKRRRARRKGIRQ